MNSVLRRSAVLISWRKRSENIASSGHAATISQALEAEYLLIAISFLNTIL